MCAQELGERFVSRRLFLKSCLAFSAIQPSRAQPVALTIAGLSYTAANELQKEALDEFNRKTGIHVNVLPAWGTSTDQLNVALRTLKQHFGSPEVYVIDVIWPGALAHYLLDLTSYVKKEIRDQLPELLKNDSVGGRLVSFPFYLNVGMLYYRTDLLKKHGFHGPPGTWQDLERMAAKIQRAERAAGHPEFWGYVWQGSAYEGLTCNALEWQVSAGGGRVIEPDGTVSVDNPRSAAALRMAAGWVGSISPPTVLSYTESDSLNVFRSGNAAFLRYWSSGYSPASSADSPIQGRFGVTLLPAGRSGRAQTMGGFQLGVSRYSLHSREAAELVEYLSGSEVQKRRAVNHGYLPALPGLYNDPQVLAAVPQAKALREAGLESWVARPSAAAGSRYADVSRIYYEGVHSILSHEQQPEKTLQSMERGMLELMRQAH